MSRDFANLLWFLQAPGLLQPSATTPDHSLIRDEELRGIFSRHKNEIEKLSPEELASWLESSRITRRLGRYVESLSEWVVSRYLQPSRFQLNTPIQDEGRTIGELDLLFNSPEYLKPQHWELSVKFYICTARTQEEASDPRFYMGTFVEDRFDKKVDHLFNHQLTLTQAPAAQTLLEQQGWPLPFENRALMKGLFFYPSDRAFAKLPEQLSPDHERGWWTTSDQLQIQQRSHDSRYLHLNQLQWLGRFNGQVAKEELLTKEQLEDFVKDHFAGEITQASLRRRELTFVEVEVEGHLQRLNEDETDSKFGSNQGQVLLKDLVHVKEISRGHFVHERWPELARWAADQTFADLERSKKENSKRP